MKNTYKDLVIDFRRWLISKYGDEVEDFNRSPGGGTRLYLKGMIMGLRLSLLHFRWLHREIKKRESEGMSLVWISEEEKEILHTFNP